MLNKTTLLWLLVSCATAMVAQNELTFIRDGQVLSMEARMAQEKTQGADMLVLRDGQVVLHEQYGFRDTEAQLPVTENTVFQVGSISQLVTNFAILQLVGQGVLDLDTDVNTYLKSWQLPANRVTRAQAVTIRDLLLQRRGFKFPYKPKGYAANAELPTHLELLNGTGEAQNPTVRLRKNVNKSGNHSFAPALILQQVLMDHYEQPFAELMQANVLDPLGMTNSFFAKELSPEQRSRLAVGYEDEGEPLPDGYRRFAELGASGLYATAADYGRFIQAILESCDEATTHPVLPTSLALAALQPTDNSDVLLFNRGDDYFFWGGAAPGYYTQFEAALDGSWVVVAFMNENLNWSFNREMRESGKAVALAAGSTSSESDQDDK
ncbi:MAG: serine hydrolase domain-containing protein [Bacteroidota bacterium]